MDIIPFKFNSSLENVSDTELLELNFLYLLRYKRIYDLAKSTLIRNSSFMQLLQSYTYILSHISFCENKDDFITYLNELDIKFDAYKDIALLELERNKTINEINRVKNSNSGMLGGVLSLLAFSGSFISDMSNPQIKFAFIDMQELRLLEKWRTSSFEEKKIIFENTLKKTTKKNKNPKKKNKTIRFLIKIILILVIIKIMLPVLNYLYLKVVYLLYALF